MIHLEHVRKTFGENTVLKDVDFVLRPGEVVGLVGPSGGGKSVLLKILGKVLEPTSGTIEYENEQGDSKELTVGFLFQEGALFDSMTVLENVAFAARHTLVGKSHAEIYEKSQDILAEVGLAKSGGKLPGQLSGGMRRRVGIARALVAHPELVLLDDPTGGLDPVAASVIIDLILELHQLYRPTVVIVSHDIRRLLPKVERVLSLFDGTIVNDSAPRELEKSASEDVLKFLRTRFDFGVFHQEARHP